MDATGPIKPASADNPQLPLPATSQQPSAPEQGAKEMFSRFFSGEKASLPTPASAFAEAADAASPSALPRPAGSSRPSEEPRPAGSFRPSDSPVAPGSPIPTQSFRPADSSRPSRPSDSPRPAESFRPADFFRPSDTPRPENASKPSDSPTLPDAPTPSAPPRPSNFSEPDIPSNLDPSQSPDAAMKKEHPLLPENAVPGSPAQPGGTQQTAPARPGLPQGIVVEGDGPPVVSPETAYIPGAAIKLETTIAPQAAFNPEVISPPETTVQMRAEPVVAQPQFAEEKSIAAEQTLQGAGKNIGVEKGRIAADRENKPDDFSSLLGRAAAEFQAGAVAPQMRVDVPAAEAATAPAAQAGTVDIGQALVDRILVSAPAADGSAEVRIRVDPSWLPDTEIVIGKNPAGELLVEFRTDQVDSQRFLMPNLSILRERLTDGSGTAVKVAITESAAPEASAGTKHDDASSGDGRSRNRRNVYEEQEEE